MPDRTIAEARARLAALTQFPDDTAAAEFDRRMDDLTLAVHKDTAALFTTSARSDTETRQAISDLAITVLDSLYKVRSEALPQIVATLTADLAAHLGWCAPDSETPAAENTGLGAAS